MRELGNMHCDKSKKKVVIIDDHPIVRHALTQLINMEPDMTVAGQADDAASGLALVERQQPDAAIVDLSLRDSNGIELVKDLRVRWPRLPILVVSMHDESLYAERSLRAGARGYVTKSEPPQNVLEGLRRTMAGGIYVSDRVASRMLGRIVNGRGSPESFPIERLSDRELEVFEFIGQGFKTRQIAQKLHLSAKTVDAHRENIKRKLKLTAANELVQQAIAWMQYQSGR